MVVVFNVKRVPGLALELHLPGAEGLLHLAQIEGPADHVGGQAVGLHMGEGDHLVQHLILPLGDVAQGGVRGGHGAFPHGEAVVVIQHVPLELRQILLRGGQIAVVLHAVGHGDPGMTVRQPLGLGDEGDHVLPEAVHSQVQPEAQDVLHFLPDLGIGHVQVRLFFREKMQIIFVEPRVIFPGAAFEQTGPVVGRQPAAAQALAGAPVIVIVIGIVPALLALKKPGVLVGAVVHHQVHEDLQPPVVGLGQDLLEQLQIAEIRVDILIVGDVVAVIRVGRGVNGGEPDGVHPQALDVIQLAQYAPKVADAVPVPVAEAPGPDLVDGHLLIPRCLCHVSCLPYVFRFQFITAAPSSQPESVNCGVIFPKSFQMLTKR